MLHPKQSRFTYAITRHYPFPWFDWVVAIYIVLCVALFTVINLGTSGYNLQTKYTTNPNGTVAQRRWFQKAPVSWINSFSPSCQGASISKGSSYFTTNLGLIYTVDKILRSANGSAIPVPAVSYSNTTLENCTVNDIKIQFQRRDYSQENTNPSNFWTWDGTYTSARATCDVIADSEIYSVRFSTSLPIIREAANNVILGTFVQLNNQTHPSIWWGANLLNLWYPRLAMVMASVQTMQDGSRIDSAQMSVVPNTTHTDITSLNFFNQASLIYSNNNGTFYSAAPPKKVTLQDLNENVGGNYPSALSRISVNVDAFAKSFYSTILTDLGQIGKSNALSNSSESGIQYLLSALSDVSTTVGGSAGSNFVFPHNNIPQIEAYDRLKGEVPLKVEPTTIYTQYACSIPKLKDTPSLIVSIVIGDLVLLQAAWATFKWIASKFLESKDERADWCDGCVFNADSVPEDASSIEDTERPSTTVGAPSRLSMSTEFLLPLRSTSPRMSSGKEIKEYRARLNSVDKAKTY